MAEKKAITGLKGVVLAPITENTATSYKTGEANVALPYVKSMTRTVKETSQDLYYDDALYMSVKSILGEEVEMRFAEVDMQTLETLGLGKYDSSNNTFEGNFNVTGKQYALCCIADTASNLPFYMRWRVFDLSSISFDSFNTRADSISVSEVIVKGTFSAPLLASAKPYKWRSATSADDISACETWLKAAETLPGA